MILDKIMKDKLDELEATKAKVPLAELQGMLSGQPSPLDFARAIKGEGIQIIAEVKKASPSRGVICRNFDPVALAKTYAGNGAAAISVLTEAKYFQGSLDYLREIGDALGSKRAPLLRKDFICDSYQVYESRAYGADALLLIVAVLEPEQLKELLGLGRQLGMGCLVEVHDEDELGIAQEAGAGIIGINNRDLSTFDVDLGVTKRLRSLIPPDNIVVSESGIKGRGDMERLKEWGVDAVLVGEFLVSADDIPAKMKELM